MPKILSMKITEILDQGKKKQGRHHLILGLRFSHDERPAVRCSHGNGHSSNASNLIGTQRYRNRAPTFCALLLLGTAKLWFPRLSGTAVLSVIEWRWTGACTPLHGVKITLHLSGGFLHSFLSSCWMNEDPCIWKYSQIFNTTLIESYSMPRALSVLCYACYASPCEIFLPLFQIVADEQGILELLQRLRFEYIACYIAQNLVQNLRLCNKNYLGSFHWSWCNSCYTIVFI